MQISSEWSIYMYHFLKKLLPVILVLVILASLVWYCFVYDRDFTRDMLLQQARQQSMNGNSRVASWFYDLAYEHSGQDEIVAIELANQFKAEGNYTKAEYTLSNAIADGGTVELYIALCKTYIEQDKLLDAVNMLDNIADPAIKAEIEAMRPAAPTTDPVPGFYNQYIPVSLTGTTGFVYYTTDGEYPSTANGAYAEPFTLKSGETTVMAVAVDQQGLVSPRSIYGYTVGGVIEEVHFTDKAIESAVRKMINREDNNPLMTSDLWNITSFTVPADAVYCEDLMKLSRLNSLIIESQTFDTLRFLSALVELTELTMTNCRFQNTDLTTIAALPSLQRLTLDGCNISTVAGIETAQNLLYLNLANNTVRNLEPIAYLMKLQEIDLRHNARTSLTALGGLTELQKLNVSYNSLTSVAPLATCTKLTRIEANNNSLISISGVENLPALTYLAVNHNDLTDISTVATRSLLTELHIANNEITDITSLSALNKLEVLDFSNNTVTDLPEWADNASLRIIDGSHNGVTSLKNLKNQMNLTHVYMDYNNLKSVTALENCYKLVLVNVYGNDIDDVKALTDHDIIVNWDPT